MQSEYFVYVLFVFVYNDICILLTWREINLQLIIYEE